MELSLSLITLLAFVFGIVFLLLCSFFWKLFCGKKESSHEKDVEEGIQLTLKKPKLPQNQKHNERSGEVQAQLQEQHDGHLGQQDQHCQPQEKPQFEPDQQETRHDETEPRIRDVEEPEEPKQDLDEIEVSLENKARIVLDAMRAGEQFGRNFTHFEYDDESVGGFPMPRQVLNRHFVKDELTLDSALILAYKNRTSFATTIFERPSSFDLIYINGHGHKLVSNRRVKAVRCWWSESIQRWTGKEMGRCLAIFAFYNETGVHLLGRASLATAIEEEGQD